MTGLARWAIMLYLVAGLAMGASGQRVANTDHYITAEPSDADGYMIANYFPFGDTMEFLIDSEVVPDGSGRIFLLGQGGDIFSFQDTQPPSAPVRIHNRPLPYGDNPLWGLENGALGMALHSDYATNGYLYYVYNFHPDGPGNNGYKRQIRRLTESPVGSNNIMVDSMEVIYEYRMMQPGDHKSGDLVFGPEGYLYAMLGYVDNIGGGILSHELGSEYGKVLRLDVDNPADGKLYSVPADNPFLGVDGALPEIWARGLRNPFKVWVDPLDGRMYVGDVGETVYEEITEVFAGAHLGWPFREGVICTPSHYLNCNGVPGGIEFTDPIIALAHDNPFALEPPDLPIRSLTMGPIYRGDAFPELQGAFIYGDFSSSYIAMVRHDGQQITEQKRLAQGLAVSHIGTNTRGELILLNYLGFQTGRSVKTLHRNTPGAGAFPTLLSDQPWLLDVARGIPVEGVHPYEVNAPLWSDGASKTRYIAVPGLDTFGFRESNGYDFTTHTLFIKNFELELRMGVADSNQLVETRLLVNRGKAGWTGYSYRWLEDESDAVLLSDARHTQEYVIHDRAATRTQTWTYPSRTDCLSCHTGVKNTILGFETPQLNREVDFDDGADNQLEHFEQLGYFDAPLPVPAGQLPRLESYADDEETELDPARVEAKARAYLHANCASCHQPGGTTPVNMDLRAFIPVEAMNVVGEAPSSDLGSLLNVGDVDRVRAGNYTQSMLWLRMAAHGDAPYSMPPLARAEVDENGAILVRTWIQQLVGLTAADGWWAELD